MLFVKKVTLFAHKVNLFIWQILTRHMCIQGVFLCQQLSKKFLNLIFIDGLSGMALGLFSTLIIGTILKQAADLIDGDFGYYLGVFAVMAQRLTGAGIGIGVAYKYKSSTYVTLSAAAAGMIGAYATAIISGSILSDGTLVYSGPGDPLSAFIAALAGIAVGSLPAGKTKLDLLITPAVTIIAGGAVGIIVGPPVSTIMTRLGDIINWGTVQQPLIMGIVVSVIMGMVLTLPISSAALGIILGLSGPAAGAATIGCCCQMIGFAVASFRENGVGGLLAQGIGTSMLQVPNIIRHPQIWIPEILSSAILGPIAISRFVGMTNNATGSGMGTSGLVGQIMTWQTMTAVESPVLVLIKIFLFHFILPGLLTLVFSEAMRKKNWIKSGDMKLSI